LLLGLVGEDEEAAVLERLVSRHGIECRFSRNAGRPTITKTRVQSRGQQLIRLDREEPAAAEADGAIMRMLIAALKEVDAVVLSDYGKGALAQAAELIGACRKADLPVLVDPKGTDFFDRCVAVVTQ
jgi:D-beta-D-heptose 7-phosphate kinase/D-beta-D-heptose 1-phosphate adenosyltransferase